MNTLYLVTGAGGHLGSILVRRLLDQARKVRALVFPGEESYVPDSVEKVTGDITDPSSLEPFFDRSSYESAVLYHCAAVITIASGEDKHAWNVNVNGTRNVLEQAKNAQVDRMVYVSSVHAIPELPDSEVITEVDHFSPDLVSGAYAKSKAAAAQEVLEAASDGLNASIVHPSGIIGPGDKRLGNHMIRTILSMAEGKIPVSLAGGYDFVDARDVAEGMLACEEKGRKGQCYILSGHYVTITNLLCGIRELTGKAGRCWEMPYGLAKAFAPVSEAVNHLFGVKKPLFTPYSIATLHSNGNFSHEKASRELGYSPRSLKDTLRDTLTAYGVAVVC